MRDYLYVDCDLAREALSARIDGEREPAPSARVDQHVAGCADCREWFSAVQQQAQRLRELSRPPSVMGVPAPAARARPARTAVGWLRWGLAATGLVQLGLAAAQALGSTMGLAHGHGMAGAGHLLNESTAWSIALGLVMIIAARWPATAAGLAGVLVAFVGVLTAYVIVDAAGGHVTLERVLTHSPAVVGAILALLVSRRWSPPRPTPENVQDYLENILPRNESRGRRGHLWPSDGSAA